MSRHASRLLLALVAALPSARASIELAYTFTPGVQIPDYGQYVDSRILSDPGLASISAVSVDLSLDSAPGGSMWLGDLFVSLTHGLPEEIERMAVLLNRPGRDSAQPFGSDLGSLSVTLDDSAAANVFSVSSGAGVYRPDGRADVDPFAAPVAFAPGSQTLGALNGAWLASGRWSLLVADTVPGDTARLASWTLRVSGEAAPSSTLTVSPASTATFTGANANPVSIQTGGTARFLGSVTGPVTLSGGSVAEFSGTVSGDINAGAGGTIRLGPSALFSPSGPFQLPAAATLAGRGTVTSPVQVAGTLSPGASPGILTFTAGLALTGTSVTILEIGGTERGVTYDGINLTTAGQLAYGGTLNLQITAPLADGTYHLFARDGLVAQTGNFGAVSIGGSYAFAPGAVVITPGSGWTTSLGARFLAFSNETGDLIVSTIPEPATAGVLAGVAALLLARRRKPRGAASAP